MSVIFLYSKGERTLQRYKRIHVEPVALHVPKELRDSWGQQIKKHSKLQKYFTRELEQRMSHSFVLTDTPGPDTLTLRVAITGGELNLQPLKPYQIFPWALIIQGVGEASGLRGKMFNMYQEAELVDSVTGNQIVALVGGLQLGPVSRRALDRMSTEELKIMVDDWINAFCRNLPMCHQPEELSDPLSESSGKR